MLCYRVLGYWKNNTRDILKTDYQVMKAQSEDILRSALSTSETDDCALDKSHTVEVVKHDGNLNIDQ